MNAKELKILKELLLERQQEILAQVGASSEDIGKLQGENAADWVDRVSLDAAMNSLMSKESDLAQELERIVEALHKIEKGGYGTCEGCETDILFDRLEAVPMAKFCINCKNEMEKQQSRGTKYRGPSSIPKEVFEWYE
jgi:DnaK suppressor protein